MDGTEPHVNHSERSTIESDPAYDFGEDQEIDEAWVEDNDVADDEERTVPLDEADELRDDTGEV